MARDISSLLNLPTEFSRSWLEFLVWHIQPHKEDRWDKHETRFFMTWLC